MNEVIISVVMPVYNREMYVSQAIKSILNQSYKDFEFIIVNDGSTDKTEEIIHTFTDERIKYFKLSKNSGNTVARNFGMKKALGKYIAIMDSDDISVPERLEIQLNYLEKHPEIGILGGFKRMFDKEGWFIQNYPAEPEYLKSYLFFKNAVGQPTVMLRKEIIEKFNLYYKPELENMEDYNLWYRASMERIKLSNISQVLLNYRLSSFQMSSNIEDRKIMLQDFFKERLQTLGIKLNEEDFLILHNFIRSRVEINNEKFNKINFLLNLIEKENIKIKLYKPVSFKAALLFFRFRLIKYYFLENQKNKSAFANQILKLAAKSGLKAIIMFWQNEGKYINKFGRKHKHKWKAHQENLFRS